MGISNPEIQKSRRKCLDLDGSMKSKSKAGRSGKSSSIACKIARYASPQDRLQKLNECKRLVTTIIKMTAPQELQAVKKVVTKGAKKADR